MWSKRVSELWDIARISELKWHTASSGCYEAPTDFSLLVAQNLSSNKNIAIVRMLNVDNNTRKVDSVVAGTIFCRCILSCQNAGDAESGGHHVSKM